jgi:hypothetical protein
MKEKVIEYLQSNTFTEILIEEERIVLSGSTEKETFGYTIGPYFKLNGSNPDNNKKYIAVTSFDNITYESTNDIKIITEEDYNEIVELAKKAV